MPVAAVIAYEAACWHCDNVPEPFALVPRGRSRAASRGPRSFASFGHV